MLTSVIIVNFNAGPLLRECIERVLASSVAVELVLVDNGSSDASLASVELLLKPPHRLVLNQQNLGFARAVNLGLEAAAGDFLLLLNPDCLVNPETLEQMLAHMQRHEDVGMAGCRILNPDGTEQRGCRRDLPDLKKGLSKALGLKSASFTHDMDWNESTLPQEPVCVPAISGSFMLVRRVAYQQVGGMDERYFLHCEDLDWCYRFGQGGWKILFVPGIEVVHHQGTCSKATPAFVLWHKHRGMALYFDQHLASQHSPPVRWLVKVAIGLRLSLLAVRSWILRR